ILYCEAADNFTRFYLEGVTNPLLICKTLKYFEEILKEHRFLRIHRSHMINPDYVIRYTKGKGGSVTMKNNKELEMSAEKRHQFLGMFEK
ncbi:MAG: LytTR family DNA-binding domain-containing protein, partial [Ferruginibacter sp.]